MKVYTYMCIFMSIDMCERTGVVHLLPIPFYWLLKYFYLFPMCQKDHTGKFSLTIFGSSFSNCSDLFKIEKSYFL